MAASALRTKARPAAVYRAGERAGQVAPGAENSRDKSAERRSTGTEFWGATGGRTGDLVCEGELEVRRRDAATV